MILISVIILFLIFVSAYGGAAVASAKSKFVLKLQQWRRFVRTSQSKISDLVAAVNFEIFGAQKLNIGPGINAKT